MRHSQKTDKSTKLLIVNNNKKKAKSRRALAPKAKFSVSTINNWDWNEERFGVFDPCWYKGVPTVIEQYGYYIKGLIEKDYRISLEANVGMDAVVPRLQVS